jgi:hypothetical protein
MVGFAQESRTPNPRMNPVTTFSDPYIYFSKNPNQNHHNEDGHEIFLTNI